MNKAFVKEAEDETAAKCPVCHAIGLPVGAATLAEHVEGQAAAHLATGTSYFCPNTTCDVAFFDLNRQRVETQHLRGRCWVKTGDERDVVCACLKVTAAEVIADAKRKDPSGVRKILAHAKEHAHDCARLMPTGKPCTAEVQQLYLKKW